MALTDLPQVQTTITDVANQVRGHIASAAAVAEVNLLKIRNLVREHGRSAVAAELGNDATALLTTYAKFKEAIEAAKNVTVEDLPN